MEWTQQTLITDLTNVTLLGVQGLTPCRVAPASLGGGSVEWEEIQNKPDTYPPDAHAHAQYLESVAWSIITDKPSTYPPETHSHDYVPLSQGLTICYASWVGDGESEREITLSGTPLIHTLRSIDLSISPTVYFWRLGYPAGYLKTISSSGISGITNQWEFNPDSSTFDIISANINTPGSTYRLFLLGYRT